MARIPDLIAFCAAHGLKMLTVASLIRYRLQQSVTSSAWPSPSSPPVTATSA